MCVVSCMLHCPLGSCSVVHGVSYVIEVGERVGLHRTVTGPRSSCASDLERCEPQAQGFEDKTFENLGCASGHEREHPQARKGVQACVSRCVRAVYTETYDIHEIP